MKKKELKKPIVIYLLAACFLLAPFGNVITSLIMQQVPNWYYPDIFFQVMKTVPPWDWFWLTLVFSCGVALLKAHKLSWTFAIVTLTVVLGMNVFKLVHPGPMAMNGMVKTQIALSVVFTGAVLLIAFYFRYPYLDRRTTWFSTSRRFDVTMPVAVIVKGKSYSGTLENLSLTGARVKLENSPPDLTPGEAMEISFTDLNNIKVESEVVALAGEILRTKFKELSKDSKILLQDYMYDQKQKMIGATESA